MSEDMQQDAVDCASQALEKYNIEKDIAAYIKKEFDKKYNPTWHCIVGESTHPPHRPTITQTPLIFSKSSHHAIAPLPPSLNIRQRTQFWFIRHTRNKALHLLLSWTGRRSAFQEWLDRRKEVNGRERKGRGVCVCRGGVWGEVEVLRH